MSVIGGLVVCVMVVAGVLVLSSENPPPVTKLPAGSQVFGYQLAADGQGAATIVWSTSDFVGDSGASIVRVSEQNSEGRWSRAVQVGGPNQSLNPVLAESQAGAAVIVWSYVRGGQADRTSVEAATRSSPSSAWSTPRTIWSISGVDGAQVAAGIDSGGYATVVWARYGPSANSAIWTANIDTKNARVTRPQKLIRAGAGGTDLTLAVNGAGAALLSWQHELHLTKHGNTLLPTVHAAEIVSYRQPSGTWLAPHRLSTFAYQEEPQGMNIWAPASPPSVVTTDGTAAQHGSPARAGLTPSRLRLATQALAAGSQPASSAVPARSTTALPTDHAAPCSPCGHPQTTEGYFGQLPRRVLTASAGHRQATSRPRGTGSPRFWQATQRETKRWSSLGRARASSTRREPGAIAGQLRDWRAEDSTQRRLPPTTDRSRSPGSTASPLTT